MSLRICFGFVSVVWFLCTVICSQNQMNVSRLVIHKAGTTYGQYWFVVICSPPVDVI